MYEGKHEVYFRGKINDTVKFRNVNLRKTSLLSKFNCNVIV